MQGPNAVIVMPGDKLLIFCQEALSDVDQDRVAEAIRTTMGSGAVSFVTGVTVTGLVVHRDSETCGIPTESAEDQ